METTTTTAAQDAANPAVIASLSPEAEKSLKAALFSELREEMKGVFKEVLAEERKAAPQRPPVDVVKNGANEGSDEDLDTLINEKMKHVVFGEQYRSHAKCVSKLEEVDRQIIATHRKILKPKNLAFIQKDMTTGTASGGAELVAVQYLRQPITPRPNIVPILAKLYPIDLGGEQSGDVPKYIGRPTAYMVGENSAITASSQGTDNVPFKLKKAAVKSAPMSSELLMFSRTPFLADYIRFAQDAIELKKQQQVTTGINNATNAQGFVGIDSGREVTQVGAALDWVDAYELIHGITTPYRVAGAAFGMTDACLKKFRTIKDEDGRPILTLPITPNDPYYLAGYPVMELPDIEGDGTVSSPTRIYFGLWSAFYGLCAPGQQRVDQTKEANSNFDNDTVQVRLIEMIDGKVLLDEAMCFMDVTY